MRTTSILTLSSVVTVILLSVAKVNGVTYQPEIKKTPVNLAVTAPLDDRDIFFELVSDKKEAGLVAFEGEMNRTNAEDAAPCDMESVEGICIDDIQFVETEDEIELGFDVNTYLPANFNPYAPASPVLDLNTIQFIEGDEFEGLGFETATYLPIGFNAYAGMESDLNEIEFIEEEEPVELGFDTSKYLPVGFNPYAVAELEMDKIIFIEEEEEVDLGFDVNAYLPADFDPYAPAAFDLDQIIFIEEEEEIDLWNVKQLPSNETVINF